MVVENIVSLFGKNVIKNIIFICTFITNPYFNRNFKYTNSPYSQVFGNLEKIPNYSFNSRAYLMNQKEEYVEKIYKNNTTNFENFLGNITFLTFFL